MHGACDKTKHHAVTLVYFEIKFVAAQGNTILQILKVKFCDLGRDSQFSIYLQKYIKRKPRIVLKVPCIKYHPNPEPPNDLEWAKWLYCK